jgi:hypothetical protein
MQSLFRSSVLLASLLVLGALMLPGQNTFITSTSSGALIAGTMTIRGDGQPCYFTGTNCFPVGGLAITSSHRKPRNITLAMLNASAKPISEARLAPASYVKLAGEIGMQSASVDEAKLADAINQLGLSVYDFSQVDDYLLNKAHAVGPNVEWGWKPLRHKDLEKFAGGDIHSYADTTSYVFRSVYGNEVPTRVLLEAKAILERFPDAVFMISDYETIKPDPFLAVTSIDLLSNGKLWIIDRWDEPNFGKEDAHYLTRLSMPLP